IARDLLLTGLTLVFARALDAHRRRVLQHLAVDAPHTVSAHGDPAGRTGRTVRAHALAGRDLRARTGHRSPRLEGADPDACGRPRSGRRSVPRRVLPADGRLARHLRTAARHPAGPVVHAVDEPAPDRGALLGQPRAVLLGAGAAAFLRGPVRGRPP